jgi:hypothetical protein
MAKPLVQPQGVGWPGQNWCSLRDMRLARITVFQFQERRMIRITVEERLARIEVVQYQERRMLRITVEERLARIAVVQYQEMRMLRITVEERLARIAVVQYQERSMLWITVEERLARIAFAMPMGKTCQNTVSQLWKMRMGRKRKSRFWDG